MIQVHFAAVDKMQNTKLVQNSTTKHQISVKSQLLGLSSDI